MSLLTVWSDLVNFGGGGLTVNVVFSAFRSHGNLRRNGAHALVGRQLKQAGAYLLIECDLMHCELDATWELFVKITNYIKYI